MKSGIGIIEYGAGNIFSLTCALDRQKIPYAMVKSAEDFEQHEQYIIPGVGHAGAAMKKLEASSLVPLIKKTKKPVLGICVGMQLLTEHSEEGDSQMTGIIPLKTSLFPASLNLKVPHIGWNQVEALKEDPLFEQIGGKNHFYFVHSYFIEFNPNFTLGSTEYGKVFSSSIRKNNFWGVQFHPEKSGLNGERLLTNFYHLLN